HRRGARAEARHGVPAEQPRQASRAPAYADQVRVRVQSAGDRSGGARRERGLPADHRRRLILPTAACGRPSVFADSTCCHIHPVRSLPAGCLSLDEPKGESMSTTTATTTSSYPTRVGSEDPIVRKHQTVWGSAADGPFSAEELEVH